MSNNGDYDKLDMPEFFAGFLAMIKPYDTALRSAMLLHLEILATKAISYLRHSLCSFHANVVEQVELKQLDWIDTSEIHERPTIFFRHFESF